MGQRLERTKARKLKNKLITSTIIVGAIVLIIIGLCYINMI